MRLMLSRIYSLLQQKSYAKYNTYSKKKIRILIPDNFRKSHQISWNLDEWPKSYKAKYTNEEGACFGPQTFLAFSVFTNVFALELETRLYYLSITITTDPSPAQMAFKFDNSSNFQNLITNNPQPRESLWRLAYENRFVTHPIGWKLPSTLAL